MPDIFSQNPAFRDMARVKNFPTVGNMKKKRIRFQQPRNVADLYSKIGWRIFEARCKKKFRKAHPEAWFGKSIWDMRTWGNYLREQHHKNRQKVYA